VLLLPGVVRSLGQCRTGHSAHGVLKLSLEASVQGGPIGMPARQQGQRMALCAHLEHGSHGNLLFPPLAS
jgi:hypothetical protein